MLSASAFGSADNTYLDLEYSDLAVLAMFLANSSPFSSWRNDVPGRKTNWSMTRARSRMDKLNNNIILLVSSVMSRCQNSQSNSQSYKKLLKLLKWNSNQKEIEKKVTKKASPSLSPFSITHTVP